MVETKGSSVEMEDLNKMSYDVEEELRKIKLGLIETHKVTK